MSAVGYASIPVTLSFANAAKAVQSQLKPQLDKLSKDAAAGIDKNVGSAVDAASKKVERARQRETKATEAATQAESKLKAETEKREGALKRVESATLNLEMAQRKSADAVAKAQAEYDKLVSSGTASAEQLAAAERKIADARDKGKADVLKREEQLDKARSALTTQTQHVADAEVKLTTAKDKAAEASERVLSATKQLDDAQENAATSTQGMTSMYDKMRDSASTAAGKIGDFAQKYQIHASVALGALGAVSKRAMDYAAEAEQSYGAVESIFKSHADTINSASQGAADAVGMSGRAYREQASYIGAMLKNQGVASEDLASRSQELIKLGSDLAATYGGDVASAVEAIGATLRGETDPIERYGVSIKQADVNAKMAAMGLDGLSGEAEKAARSQALLALLTEQTADAQGQFARETDTAAHKQQVATARIDDAREAIGTALLPVMADLMEKASGVATVIGEHPKVFVALGAAIAGLMTTVVAVGTIAPIFTAVAAAAAAAEMSMWGYVAAQVAAAAPILGVVAAIAAVVGALTLFFTKTEIGREAWQAFTDMLSVAWDGASAAVGAGIDWLGEKWDQFTTGFGQFYQTWVAPVWESFKTGVAGLVQVLAPAFTQIQIAFQLVGTVLRSVYDNMVAPIFGLFRQVVGLTADVLTGNFDNIGNRFTAMGELIGRIVMGPIMVAIDTLKAIINAVAATFSNLRDAAARAVSAVAAKMGEMVSTLRSIPSKVGSIFSNAGRWLVNSGKNIIQGLINGILSMSGRVGNAIQDIVPFNIGGLVPGFSIGGELPGFARGGVLPDIPGISRNERDPILGYSRERKMPIARIEPGEFVVNRDATAKHLPLLQAINSGRINPAQGDLGLPRFANGGVVSARQLLAFADGQRVNGQQAPRSLEGIPYVWGGGLLANWGDCSGAMSGLAALAAGVSVRGRKFATGTEGQWLGANGFTRGTSAGRNAFEIGYFNGGPYGGHTSGTVYDENGKAVNVEMGGGRGNGQIGGRAAGSRHPQYTDRYYINLPAAAGAAVGAAAAEVLSTSVEGVTVAEKTSKQVTARQIDWGTAAQLASKYDSDTHRDAALREYLSRRAKVYDTGGILPTGGVAVNLGKPELIFPAEATTAMLQMARQTPQFAQAMEQLSAAAPELAAAVDKFTDLDYGAVAEEITAAWRNEDFGYGELARAVGEEAAERIVTEIAFIGDQIRDMQDGSNMRAYLANMSASEAVGLADRAGQLVGIQSIGSTFGGVAKGYEALQDAAVMQVDALDAVKQAEENLVDVRRQAAEITGDADAPDEDKKKALEAVTAAEKEHSKALGVVQMASRATGQAQIAMAFEVAEMVIGIGKKIWDVVVKITDWINNIRIQTRTAVWELTKSWSELTGVVDQHRGMVAQLQMQLVNAAVDVIGKSMEMRTAQVDVVRAQLEGAKNVAEAEAALQGERDKVMGKQKWNFRDMSLEYDRFRDGYRLGMSEQIAGMTHLSERERERIRSAMTGVGLLSDEERGRVFDAVAGMTDLTVEERDRINAALAGVGELTVEERARVANAIAGMSGLSEEERERIIRAINGVSEVAQEERLRVVAALTGIGSVHGKQQDLTNQIVANVDKEGLAVKLGLDAKLAAQKAADDAYIASVNGREVGERELHQMYKLQLAEQLVGEQAFQNLKDASLDAQLEWQRRVDKAAQLGLKHELEARAAVTPEILALQREVYAAEFAQQKSILDAQIKGIEATFAQQKALVAMGRLQEDLVRQQAELDRLSGQTMGMNQGQAIVMEEIARLRKENAEILGKRNSAAAGARNFFGRMFDWDGDGNGGTNTWSVERKQYDAQIAANNAQIAELKKSVYAEGAFTTEQQRKIDEATELASKYFAQGNEAAAKAALAASPLGNAQRSLEVNKTLSRITDWEAKQRELQREQRDALAEFKVQRRLFPLRWRSQELESRESAQRYAADALRSDNDGVRDALATLSRLEESNAAELKQLREKPTVVNVTVPGPRDGVTTIGEMEDALVALAGELGVTRTDVKRLNEARRTSASDRVRAAIGR